MTNELSVLLARTCIGCRHCKLTRWYGTFNVGVPVKYIRCEMGHRQLRDEDLTADFFGNDELAHELNQEHLYLHSPHYDPDDDIEGEFIKVTKDGWAGGQGKDEAMLWRIDCPDWEGDG